MPIPETPEELLAMLKHWDFHIGDGIGDSCSGYDEEDMLYCAEMILKRLKEDAQS